MLYESDAQKILKLNKDTDIICQPTFLLRLESSNLKSETLQMLQRNHLWTEKGNFSGQFITEEKSVILAIMYPLDLLCHKSSFM